MSKNSAKMIENDEKIAIKISVFSIFCNVFLSIFKLIAGIIGMSYAMISDAVHSFSDVFTTIIVILGIKISNKKADKGHPFGHERFECVAALILSFILFDVGLIIGYTAIESLISGAYKMNEFPKLIALIAAVVSILTQVMLFIVARKTAKKINSGALKADAWHHLSDSLSSIGSFIGILGAMLGVYVLDIIAGLVIALIILKVAVDIFIDSVNKMTDKSVDVEIENKIKDIAESIDGVKNIDLLRTRQFGNKIYVEIEIACDKDSSLTEAHGIAQNLHDKIEKEVDMVKHCMVHVNPYKYDQKP